MKGTLSTDYPADGAGAEDGSLYWGKFQGNVHFSPSADETLVLAYGVADGSGLGPLGMHCTIPVLGRAHRYGG